MASKTQEQNQKTCDFKNAFFSTDKNDDGDLTADEQLELLAEIIADFLHNEIKEQNDKQLIE